MHYFLKSIDDNDIDNVFLSYFLYYTNIYGPSPLTPICKLAIKNGHYDSKVLSIVDLAYELTMEAINKSKSGEFEVIAIKDQDNQTIGYFRPRYIPDEKAVVIDELVLPVGLDGDKVEILKELITIIETYVEMHNEQAIYIDFVVGYRDVDLQDLLFDSDYDLIEEKIKNGIVLFDKKIREIESTRKR